MKKRVWVLLIMLLALQSVIAVSEIKSLNPYVLLIDFEDKDKTAGLVIDLKLTTGNEISKFRLNSDKNGGITLHEPPLDATIEIKGDSIKTSGKDYYAEYKLSEIKDGTILELYRVGTVRGIVVDKLDNLIPDATLKIGCEKNFGEFPPEKTDKFASFEYDFAPVGSCRIYASYNDAIGFTNVNIEKGSSEYVIVKLDKAISEQDKINFPLLFLLGIVITALSTYFIFRLPSKPKKEIAEEIKVVPSRMQDLLETLNHKEKNVVEYLIKSDKKISQSMLSRHVGIPKTSLCRVIESLEQKKIICIEEVGKFREIRLTDWFLGKTN
jgi:hypothetical protein